MPQIGLPIEKVCPFFSREKRFINCLKHKCELWTTIYTTESYPVDGCSLRLLAGQNSEGQMRV